MTRKQKHLLARIAIAAILFFAGSLFYLPEYMEAGIFLICYIVVGWDIVWKAITNILHGQVFDENFLMTIATIGALVLGEHSEGVAVMLFYQVGEWFQSYAVSKSRKSIASLKKMLNRLPITNRSFSFAGKFKKRLISDSIFSLSVRKFPLTSKSRFIICSFT